MWSILTSTKATGLKWSRFSQIPIRASFCQSANLKDSGKLFVKALLRHVPRWDLSGPFRILGRPPRAPGRIGALPLRLEVCLSLPVLRSTQSQLLSVRGFASVGHFIHPHALISICDFPGRHRRRCRRGCRARPQSHLRERCPSVRAVSHRRPRFRPPEAP